MSGFALRILRRLAVVAVSALLFGACSREQPEQDACIADSIRTLHTDVSVPSCAKQLFLCRARCLAGDGASCLGVAYVLGEDPKKHDESLQFYRRACLLGNANACTNYGAAIWADDHTEEQLTCARRTFEKACAAGEHFACGMVGRIMIESTTPPRYAEGRTYLEQACDRLQGFPCRVLAMHLESGDLGDHDPKVIRALLARACIGGDPDACGTPATAADTFH